MSLLYTTGTGLFEATNMSEGRGTTLPFQTLGAPYIDWRLAEAMRAEANETLVAMRARSVSGGAGGAADVGVTGTIAAAQGVGIAFREVYFQPTFSKFAGFTAGGVQLSLVPINPPGDISLSRTQVRPAHAPAAICYYRAYTFYIFSFVCDRPASLHRSSYPYLLPLSSALR
jgi:hypothetical protein